MDLRVVKLRSAADALRTEMVALAAQQSARQTRAQKEAAGRQEQARSRQAQLPDEVARLEARIVTVQQYRAARSSKWGSELPYSLLGEVFNSVGWGGPECAAMRLVSVGWCSAHDLMCPKLRIRSWSNWPGWAAGTLKQLERVTTVDLSKVRTTYYKMASSLPLLQNLPSLTSLELGLDDDFLSEVEAKALGGLTTLSSLKLVRNLEHNFGYSEHILNGEGCMWGADICGRCGGCQGEMANHHEYIADLTGQYPNDLRSYARKDHWTEALCPMTALTHLDLSECQNVTANTLRPLSKLPALTSLELRDEIELLRGDYDCFHYSIDNEAMTAVASVSSLTSLKLEDCNDVTDKGLAELARLPALTSLHLTECYGVSKQAVEALQAAIPGLVVV